MAQTAKAIAEQMLLTLMASEKKDWLMNVNEIWVRENAKELVIYAQ